MVQLSQFHILLLLLQVGSLAITGGTADTNECANELDLAFVVDSSGSICNDEGGPCDNWRSLLKFNRNLVSAMTIGRNNVLVALVEFESSAWIQWNLTTYSDKQALLDAIDNLPYIGGNTNTTAALDLLSTVFSVERGDRPSASNKAILITDGKPKRGNDPIPMEEIRAAVKRVTDQDIRLLVVGVTDSIDMDTLEELSSPPHTINETVFIAKDYQNIDTVLKQLQIQTCANTTVPRQSTPSDLCTKILDLCFVVDGSGSICDSNEGFNYQTDETCDNWRANVKFIHDLASDFDIGLQATRIGLVVFSTNSVVMWNLTAFTDKSALLNAINNLAYHKGGRTDMTGGLRLMRTQCFGLSDDRPGIPNTAIIITDGYPTNQSTLPDEINEVMKSGIRSLVVGVTKDIDLETIRRMASPPAKENETYFLNPDYASLEVNIRSQLSTKTCDVQPSNSTTLPANIETPVGKTTPEDTQCSETLDLCFVVDASGSICDSNEGFNYERDETCNNWKYNVQFIYDVVDDFDVGLQRTRVGLVIFSTNSFVKWNLTAFTDKQALLNAIFNLTYHKGGTTDMTGGLRLMRTQCFGLSDDRLDIPNTAIIITDGYPTVSSTLTPEMNEVMKSGIRTLVVGVTNNTNLWTIKKLVSPPPAKENENYFLNADYATLGQNVRTQLSTETCNTRATVVIDPLPAPSTTTPSANIDLSTRSQNTGGNQGKECTATLDLCFVVDASGSICDTDEGFNYTKDETCNNWKYNVQFIRSVAEYFDIGEKLTRIGLVIFSTKSYVMFNLTAFTDRSNLLDAISSLTYRKGGRTDMTGGLRLMRTQCFGLSDDRPDVPNTAIIITDGYPTDPSTLQGEIDEIRKSGIRTLVVGVTNKTDLDTIKKLVSPPPPKEHENYFLNADYATLSQNVRTQLSTEACNTRPTVIDPLPATYTTTPSIIIASEMTASTKPAGEECSEEYVDLCILVDASGSICDTDNAFVFSRDSTCNNWNLIVQFIHKLVDDIFSSPYTRIGLIKFSTQAQTVFNLERYTNEGDLLSAVDNLTYVKGGTTDMTGALRLARMEVFNTAGDRAGVPNKAVIITDGYPTQPSTLQAEIDAARNSDIRILALGVTKLVDESTLRRLSGPPPKINETYFMALDYVDIESFRQLLQQKICQPSN